MALMPSMHLSQFSQVIVGARISKNGDATPKHGDLQGETGPVTPMATVVPAIPVSPVSIIIDQIRP
ncbi:cytochrome c-type biogenesis protein CcmH [Gammaproteobacteria bacterium]